jgi:hypothetical protein
MTRIARATTIRTPFGVNVPGWTCTECGQQLAYLDQPDSEPYRRNRARPGALPRAVLRRELVRLPDSREGLHAYGLPQRELRGKQPKPRTERGGTRLPSELLWQVEFPVTLPFYVFCPRPGVCGIGQVVNLPMEEALANLTIG